jgi:hypothetical protein
MDEKTGLVVSSKKRRANASGEVAQDSGSGSVAKKPKKQTIAEWPAVLITDIGRDIDDTLAILTLFGIMHTGGADASRPGEKDPGSLPSITMPLRLVGVVATGGANMQRVQLIPSFFFLYTYHPNLQSDIKLNPHAHVLTPTPLNRLLSSGVGFDALVSPTARCP